MAVIVERDGTSLFLAVVVIIALAFAGGYYYYQQKDKDTILDLNVGGKNITATVEHQ